MVTKVLRTLYNQIIQDAYITSILKTKKGEPTIPAVYEDVAPTDTLLPYLVIRWNGVESDSKINSSITYNIEIFDQSDNSVTANRIADRLEQLFNDKIFNNEGTTIRVSRNLRTPNISDVITEKHIHLDFEVVYSREDLI